LTEEDRDGGIYPYGPRIPFVTGSVLSYNRTIERLERVITAPTLLESTSHVLGIGVDLFYTRTSPSGSFDVLNSDFSYITLIATTATLTVIAIVLKWLEKRKRINKLWK
jgi:hypothetical protein